MTAPYHSRVLIRHYFGKKLGQLQHHLLDNAPHAMRKLQLEDSRSTPNVLAGVKARPSQRKYKEEKKSKKKDERKKKLLTWKRVQRRKRRKRIESRQKEKEIKGGPNLKQDKEVYSI